MSNITGFPDSHFTSGMRMSLIRLPEFTALGGQLGVGGVHMREDGLQPPSTAPSCRESGHNLVLQRAYMERILETLSRQMPPLYR